MQYIWSLVAAIRELLQPKDPVLLLQSFAIKRKIADDHWNKKPGTEITCHVLDDNGKCFAEFEYRTTVGQVGRISIVNGYRNSLLKEQIVLYMMREMQQAGATHIWEAMPSEYEMAGFAGLPFFYTRLWGFKFAETKVHPTVSGGGYIMEIPSNINELRIKASR